VWRIKRSEKGRERIGEGGSVENKEEWRGKGKRKDCKRRTL
jgi:hypothetical protein